MFHTPIDTRFGNSPALDRLLAFGGRPLNFPSDMDLCREQVPATADCDGLRFAAAARQSASRDAFRPAFANADWRVFASFCVVRRLPAGYRVLIPGRSERTLSFVVEGCLWQQSTDATPAAAADTRVVAAGAVLGADSLFSDAPCALDVRTLEDSVVLELSLARQRELTASCPEIAFELLRAAGAVIAARCRPCAAHDECVAN
jgi:CRP/FNR family transcriptional regulator, cyclic AMP receptor protein